VKTESLYSSHRKLRICLLLYVTVWVLYCDFLQRLEFSARIAECHPGLLFIIQRRSEVCSVLCTRFVNGVFDAYNSLETG